MVCGDAFLGCNYISKTELRSQKNGKIKFSKIHNVPEHWTSIELREESYGTSCVY